MHGHNYSVVSAGRVCWLRRWQQLRLCLRLRLRRFVGRVSAGEPRCGALGLGAISPSSVSLMSAMAAAVCRKPELSNVQRFGSRLKRVVSTRGWRAEKGRGQPAPACVPRCSLPPSVPRFPPACRLGLGGAVALEHLTGVSGCPVPCALCRV